MSLEVHSLERAAPVAEGQSRVRRFAVAWRNPTTPLISPVGVLEHDGVNHRFFYLATARQIPEFRPLLEFPDLDRVYVSPRLFTFFAQRVMDRKRPDFPDYVTALDLPPTATDLDLLGRSGGRRKADKVQLIEEPATAADGATSHVFLVHGVRYARASSGVGDTAIDRLRAGDPLLLVPEPDNPVNPHALLVADERGVPLGWVPDLLLDYVTQVTTQGSPTLHVARANGPDTPWHLRLLARLTGRVPVDYRPFTGPTWQPAPATISK